MKIPKLVIVAAVITTVLVVAALVRLKRSKTPSQQPQVQTEIQARDGAISSPKARERVELLTESDLDNPAQGMARIRVRQLDRQGRPGKMIAFSGLIKVYKPQGLYLELLDLDGDRDQEILVATGTGEDQGELRIYNLLKQELVWFCRLSDRAACIFPYRFNRPEVIDLDKDLVAEVIEYGPQPLGNDQFNYDRYSVYRIFIFRDGQYLEAEGTKLRELTEAFVRYSRLPLVPARIGL